MDQLTITRKVWEKPERYAEAVIKMFEQPNKTGLGKGPHPPTKKKT
jgi:hypothetical protein